MLITVILLLSLLFIVYSLVYGIRGWRFGWKYGAITFGSVLLCVALAHLLFYPLSALVKHRNAYYNLKMWLLDTAAGYGLSGLTTEKIISLSIDRLLSLLLCVLTFFVLLLLSGILRSIIRSYRKKHQKQTDTIDAVPEKRWIGLCLGIISAGFICAFLMIMSGVNLITEARHADHIISIENDARKTDKNYSTLATQGSKLIDIYFDTRIIAGNEDDKLELMNRAIRSACNKSNDALFQELGDKLSFDTRAQLEEDAGAIVSLAVLAEEEQLTETILSAFGNGGFAQLSQLSKKEELANEIYSLSFSGILVRMIMTEGIREITQDEYYLYPDYIDTSGEQEAFLEILNALPSIAQLAQEKGLKNLSDKQRQAVLSDLNILRDSSLLPAEVFAKILNAVR